ncbi:MAG: 16S rRNA (cytidine(1402)-2'-O)-methyltransferase [Hyphomicrobium sp.]
MSRFADDGASGAAPAGTDPLGQGLVRRIADQLARLESAPLAPGLYLVATPIGNLADITVRALHVLAAADMIYCEDTRHSARLLQHYGIANETRPFHEHNEDGERIRVLKQLVEGKRIALISDAGTPLVSDPGFKLVRACAEQGIAVTCIPGPSAVMTGLAASGLPTDQFFYAGFLPPKQAARRARLADLKPVPGTLIFYEAPQRTAETLADMAEVLGARPAVVARELTKLHEEFARGPLGALAGEMAAREVKGEVVILVGPSAKSVVADEEIAQRLAVALETMRLKDAAAAVADALGIAKSRVYDLGLKIKDNTPGR